MLRAWRLDEVEKCTVSSLIKKFIYTISPVSFSRHANHHAEHASC